MTKSEITAIQQHQTRKWQNCISKMAKPFDEIFLNKKHCASLSRSF